MSKVHLNPKVQNKLRFLLWGLFETFSIDVAGPFKETSSGKNLLKGVEYLTVWLLSVAACKATADVVPNFVQREIIDSFGIPKSINLDSTLCSTATFFLQIVIKNDIQLKTVLA